MKTRTLTDRPKIDHDSDWVSSVDAAVSKAAKAMCEEIDFSILADLYLQSGWVEVEIHPFMNNQQAVDMKDWVNDNCKGKTASHGRRFLFQHPEDAMWFKLRWLS